MRLLVYEFTCAEASGSASWHAEGWAMLSALLSDFEAVEGVGVVTLLTPGCRGDHAAWLAAHPGVDVWPAETLALAEALRRVDAALIIAPETDGILEERCRLVEAAGRLLVGPEAAAVALTADKWAVARLWRAHGVPTPWPTVLADASGPPAFPAVLKPRDGAGSIRTFLVHGSSDWASLAVSLADSLGHMIFQPYVRGMPASVAFLVGVGGRTPLLPAEQCLSADGRFRYLGGRLPLPPNLAERAIALASRAIACVSGLRGYVGVDLVLGAAADGSEDVAIEINPRLTTSYVGLRQLAEANLAAALWAAGRGDRISPIAWRPGVVSFAANGTQESGGRRVGGDRRPDDGGESWP
ncbi:MAG: ATP-grasp domain-containing protein [Gemmataceae bacterium]|nr:ATP-grasp domain-containing protein [Gemmataceae bacterium]MDW8266700.1 ATP-grasp domain-containing protein [Gemmataceae bacterium]